MKITLSPVRPSVQYRSYTNPNSQGSLVTRTRTWPQPKTHKLYTVVMPDWGEAEFESTEEPLVVNIPDDYGIGSIYIDHVYMNPEWPKFIAALNGRGSQQQGICTLFERAVDETILKAVSILFEAEVTAVQVVYYYNVATGYDCERIDAIYKKRASDVSSVDRR